MPRFNVFVRDEDLELWNAIEDRPRWIHDALRGTGKDYPKAVKERKEIEKLLKPVMEKMEWKPCKHNADPRFCKHAKPGKPCK